MTRNNSGRDSNPGVYIQKGTRHSGAKLVQITHNCHSPKKISKPKEFRFANGDVVILSRKNSLGSMINVPMVTLMRFRRAPGGLAIVPV